MEEVNEMIRVRCASSVVARNQATPRTPTRAEGTLQGKMRTTTTNSTIPTSWLLSPSSCTTLCSAVPHLHPPSVSFPNSTPSPHVSIPPSYPYSTCSDTSSANWLMSCSASVRRALLNSEDLRWGTRAQSSSPLLSHFTLSRAETQR
ncbi:unnamed protein product [Pleuronectes platessa]|uniref:Uncharacterized protein n=1 Tax=Pleuronectes platessa TaxID=8262 RepID=A0A9N7VMD2_PLEPL|nr:unnamed protein product [Pleuronectes platessa]